MESLKYLSSEQALGDLATFRLSMTDMFRLNEDANKWIVFGGSYPGKKWFYLCGGLKPISGPTYICYISRSWLQKTDISAGTGQF